MKAFVGGLITETNSFAMAPTGLKAFESFGESIFELLDELAAADGHEIARSILLFAQPDGPTLRSVYEELRARILSDLRSAMPVDLVILPLHGAMVAEGYPDCEGDLIAHVRAIVGPDVPIGVELDLHCHFTQLMKRSADVIVAYKEYPHTDVADCMVEVWKLTVATAERRITPVIEEFNCRMIDMWHTTREPMMSFVRGMKALEGRGGVLSVSFGHGFPWGDVPEAGAKVWVIADGDRQLAARLAAALGREIWDMRLATQTKAIPLEAALDRLQSARLDRPMVFADVADNPGGGASGDSTFFLRGLLQRNIENVVIGAFWDLGAIQICSDAGEGATLRLRIGGKCGPASGEPVDVRVTVRAIVPEHTQTDVEVAGVALDCGRSVWVRTESGVDIALVSRRQQVMHRDMFTGLGIDLAGKRAIVVKSTQHFHAAFAPLASEVHYVDTPGLLRGDFANLEFRSRDLQYWPRISNPHNWPAPSEL